MTAGHPDDDLFWLDAVAQRMHRGPWWLSAGIVALFMVLPFAIAFVQGTLTPGVRYVTSYALADASLEDEAQAIADRLAVVFDGFCHGASNVALAAYDEMPTDPGGSYESVGLVANCPG